MPRAVTAAAIALALACARSTTFVCADSTDCTDGSFNGVCQANGYCSFGDDTCPSGQRYGDLAPGDLAGTCVESDGTSTGHASTSSDAETTVVTLDGPSLEDSTTADAMLDDTNGASSSGEPAGETTTTALDTTTSAESSDSATPNDCEQMGGPIEDECNLCLYTSCCPEILACSVDEGCTCRFDCLASMVPVEVCELRCGPSNTYDALNDCALSSCGIQCGAM